jgi:hypothetical protein
VHGGGVDDDAAGPTLPREPCHLDGDRRVGDGAVEPDAEGGTGVGAERVGTVAGAGRRVDGLVVEDGVEGAGRGERVERVVDHHGGEVDVDGLEHARERVGRDGTLADGDPERVHPVLDVRDHLLGGPLDVGVGEPGAHVPALEPQVAAGGRAAGEGHLARQARLRDVGGERGRAERRDVDAVERGPGQQTPDVGVGCVVGELLRLAQDGGRGLLPRLHVGLEALRQGDGDGRLRAHAGAGVRCHRGHRRAGV